MKFKVCSSCGHEKYVEHFWKRQSANDGYESACKDCIIANRKYREDNKETLEPYQKVDREKPDTVPFTKTCKKCLETKELKYFTRRRETKDGRNYSCKACEAEARKSKKTYTKAEQEEVQSTYLAGLKQCSKCKKYKHTDEYIRQRASRDGLKAACRECEDRKPSESLIAELYRGKEFEIRALILLDARYDIYDDHVETNCNECEKTFTPTRVHLNYLLSGRNQTRHKLTCRACRPSHKYSDEL